MTLGEASTQFLSYLEYRKGRSTSTITTYRPILNSFIKYTDDICLQNLNVSIIDEYAEYLIQFNLAPKTYRNKLAPIRSLIGYLYSKNLTDIRPENIDLPKVKDTEANFLIYDEQIAMMNACRDARERAMVLTFIRCGARVSELKNFRTSDLYERSLIIRKGKGGKHRITFISEDAERAINDYHNTLDFHPTWLICAQDGTQLSRQYIHRLVVAIGERAKIDKRVTPHTLRHTFATNLLMDGAGVHDVQKMMGHSNIRNTLIYMHFTNDYLKSKYDKSITKMLI